MRLPSKSKTFILLMAASALAVVLAPTGWPALLRGFFQALAFGQAPTASVARSADVALERAFDEEIPPERARELVAENERLQRLQLDQQGQIGYLQAQVEALSGLRDVFAEGYVRIVPAPVAAYDANRRRETLQIVLTKQTAELVRPGLWVLAGAVASPTRELAGQQWVIGRVVDKQTQTARVQLVTDPAFATRVRLARLTEGGWVMDLAEECKLEGVGGGKMRITQAAGDYFATGYRLVVLPPSVELPWPVSVGVIESSSPHPSSSLHFNFEVRPWGPAEHLTQTYVLAVPRAERYPEAIPMPGQGEAGE